jgi:predicted RNase H-like HicB family nuclease
MVIEWSDEDNAYIVSLPEWGDLVHTHGETYSEAVSMGEDLLEALIASRRERHESLPAPRIFTHA